MAGIAPIHWKKFEKFLLFVGCVLIREKGDHRIYNKAGLKRPVVFSRDEQIPIFVIKANLRTLGMTPEDYLEMLKNL